MRHSSTRADGRGDLSLGASPRWLLIGNSRWHWAERTLEGPLRGWDGAPGLQEREGSPPLAWAAVGHVPDSPSLPVDRRVSLANVPLAGCPPWLGVDRALAGWEAWRTLKLGVLVADAGTVLSLTLVDGHGTFRGGRLMAGLGLQLAAMTNGTVLLPRVPLQGRPAGVAGEDDWPTATAEAMRVGVETGLAAAVIAASQASGCQRLVLTGGDAPRLEGRITPAVAGFGVLVNHRPLLCLESLANLRPEP
jgi:type III pantothenate kinase